MSAVVVAMVLATVLPGFGQGPNAWRTTDGRLYFGSSPPPGSVRATAISLSAVAAPHPEALNARAALPLRRPANETPPVVSEARRAAPGPLREAVEVAFIAPPTTVGEGDQRALTTCVRNHGEEAKRVWLVGRERVPIGVVQAGKVGCLVTSAPLAMVGRDEFHLEAEPALLRE